MREVPESIYGDIEASKLNWRKDEDLPNRDNDDPDEEPATESLIAALGFDPDEADEEEKKTKDVNPIVETILSELRNIREDVNKPSLKSGNTTSGIIVSGYTLKQNPEGEFEIYSVGGAKVGINYKSIELALQKIKEVAVDE